MVQVVLPLIQADKHVEYQCFFPNNSVWYSSYRFLVTYKTWCETHPLGIPKFKWLAINAYLLVNKHTRFYFELEIELCGSKVFNKNSFFYFSIGKHRYNAYNYRDQLARIVIHVFWHLFLKYVQHLHFSNYNSLEYQNLWILILPSFRFLKYI